MPNWCCTNYTFYCEKEHKQDLTEFHDRINKAIEGEPSIKNDFGAGWLGDILHEFCSDIAVMKDDGCYSYNDVRYRGSLTELGDIYDAEYEKPLCYFYVNTDTAWCTMNDMWNLILEKFPNIKYVYSAQEEGNRYYETNDANCLFYHDRYYIDAYLPIMTGDGDYDGDYFETVNGARAYLNDIETRVYNIYTCSDDLRIDSKVICPLIHPYANAENILPNTIPAAERKPRIHPLINLDDNSLSANNINRILDCIKTGSEYDEFYCNVNEFTVVSNPKDSNETIITAAMEDLGIVLSFSNPDPYETAGY